jgi:LysM repeat protein
VAAAAEGTEHTVMKGDSFFTLAKKYNVSTKAIASVNPGVDSTKLKIGQKLKIPAPSASTASISASPDSSATGGAEKVYVVKSSDNLNKIAKANSVTVKALRAANNLKTDQIKVGQKLKIPSKAAATADAPPAAATAAIAATNQ